MKKLLIATDAYFPQVNGVVRTLDTLAFMMDLWGYKVKFIEPSMFKSFKCPSYPEIDLAIPWAKKVRGTISEFDPDYIHVSTEGPIGLAVRNYCVKRQLPFTTSFHTQFAQYGKKIAHIPEWLSWKYIKWFHKHSESVLVPSSGMQQELISRGINNPILWSRGVDVDTFKPQTHNPYENCNFPIFLYVGRVSKEKNLESFLELREKMGMVMFWIVGDGPHRKELEAKYADTFTHFVGYKKGEELAAYYTHADVFVFPSLTDTFGLVNIEAMACGTPVASYPSTGPKDIIGITGDYDPHIGCLHKNLQTAMERAFEFGDSQRCIDFVRENYTWEASATQFEKALVPL